MFKSVLDPGAAVSFGFKKIHLFLSHVSHLFMEVKLNVKKFSLWPSLWIRFTYSWVMISILGTNSEKEILINISHKVLSDRLRTAEVMKQS